MTPITTIGFLNQVSDTIDNHTLFTSSDKLLVGLSGGADSVALLCVLLKMGYACEAVHCNFNLRGAESNRDELFVRELCAARQVPLHTKSFDTKYYASRKGISIEMAARELRYDFFEKVRTKNGLSYIAVAHHRDDNAETLLINLVRGTGVHGLVGIRPKNGVVVRPLLEVSREELVGYLEVIGQPYVTDSSNAVDDVVRNQVRLNIIPMLERINPSVKQTLAETTVRMREVEMLYREALEMARLRVMPDDYTIDIVRLKRERAAATLLFELLYPKGFSSQQSEQILADMEGESGRIYESDRWRLLRDRGRMLLQEKGRDCLLRPTVLPLEGRVEINSVLALEVSRQIVDVAYEVSKEPTKASLDVEKLELPLLIRTVEKGDRFVPFGMKGAKLVSDYMTDRKFTLFQKEQQLVVCSGGEIVWLVGQRVDNRYCVDDSTRVVLEISSHALR